MAAVLTASVVAKACVLVLECTEKRRLLRDAYRHLSLEATSGLFGRGFFWWLNGLLVTGYRQILAIPDLAAIHEKIKAETVTLQLSKEWKKRKLVRVMGRPTLTT